MKRIVTVFLVCAAPGVAHAQEPQEPQEQAPPVTPAVATERPVDPRKEKPAIPDSACPIEKSQRKLGGHTFIFPVLQASPFIASFAGMQIGASLRSASGLVTGRLGPVSISSAAIVNRIDGGVKVNDWLGFGFHLAGDVVTGTTIGTLVLEGAQVSAVGGGSLIVRLARLPATQVTGRAGLEVEAGEVFSPRRLIQGLTTVASGGNPPAGSIEEVISGGIGRTVLVSQTGGTAFGSVQVAHGFSRYFGLQLGGSVTYRNVTAKDVYPLTFTPRDTTASALTPSVAAAFSADASPAGFPFAVVAESALGVAFRDDELVATSDTLVLPSFALGVYLSGFEHLQLGVATLLKLGLAPARALDGSESSKRKDLTAALILRYVF